MAREQKPNSVLQSDQYFVNRILSRDPSVGRSTRLYYRNPGGVPFKWEVKPGKAKNPPQNDALPPIIDPPPAEQYHHQELSTPKVYMPARPKLWFWKKFKKNLKAAKKVQTTKSDQPMPDIDIADCDGIPDEEIEKFVFSNSDKEFMTSSSGSSSSSSSNGSSSINALALHQPPNLKKNLVKGFVRWKF